MDLGIKGRAAIQYMFKTAAEQGLIEKESIADIFVPAER